MRVGIVVVSISLLALAAGCAGQNEPAPSPDHPASPMAAETPPPAASTTLNGGAAGNRTAPSHDPEPAESSSLTPPVAYTCPHHPRVMEAEAGDCPLCGMALEPTASAQTSPLRQRDDNPQIDPAGGVEESGGSNDESGAPEHGGHE